MVSAVSSARFVNVATPPETVAVSVPWSGPAPLLRNAVTTVLLSLRLEVAVLVFFVDDRLRAEGLTGRRGLRRLRLDDQLGWRSRA